jgi:hypothetical protein
MLMLTIGAAALVLAVPTPAWAEDWGRIFPEMFIPGAAWILVAYSLAVLIAWVFSVFRSQTALNISQVVSAIVSIPALVALMSGLKYLPQQITQHDPLGFLHGSVLIAILLCFVWAVPIIQYKRLNRG